MKRFYKYAAGLFLTGLLSVVMISAANAQRGGRGGGGGSFRGGGGGFRTGGIGIGRGSNGLGIRGNIGLSGSFRSDGGYFAGRGYHAGSFYRPGFGYYGYPHLGFYLGSLPFGYYPFYWGSSLCYYYGGVFYSPYDNGGYQVIAPPIGAAVPSLPDSAKPIKIDGVQYYEVDGVYYKDGVNDKGEKIFIVAGRDGVLNTNESVTDPNATDAAPQVGDLVNQLPDGCRKVSLNGKKYFVSPDGIYYERVIDPNGNVAYRIASLPESEEKGI